MLFDDNIEKYEIKKKTISYSSSGVDDQLETEIMMPNNISAKFKISFKNNYSNSCIIEGTNGKIVVPQPWLPEEGSYIEIFKRDRSYKQISKANKSAYGHQIENISNVFDSSKSIKHRLFDINKSTKYISFFEKLYRQ